MYVENDISRSQFKTALDLVAAMTPEERKVEQKRLNSSGARGYYIRTADGDISMKLVIRLAYDRAGRPWKQGEGLQSKEVYQRFKQWFPIIHEPKSRVIDTRELSRQVKMEREYVNRLQRPGQTRFRRRLLELEPACALTGCRSINALEAAHIHPVADGGKFATTNGILLRADLHRLFDLGYLAINPVNGKVWLHKSCQADYADLLEDRLLSRARIAEADGAFLIRWKNRMDRRLK